jgi:hypothetical protein
MTGLRQKLTGGAAGALLVLTTATFGQAASATASGAQVPVVRAALAPGSINNVLVIELENEDATSTFGSGSVATYLNDTLVPKGELLENYYATGHVSLDNYIAQISGQAPTPLTDSDCDLTQYVNVTPGTDDPNSATYPGQVDGNGCIYPAPTATTNGAPTIANQLDAVDPPNPTTHVASWREYAEDMGNDPTRDGGTTDPLGGTDCAHPTVGGTDKTVTAEASDQYTTRHNPFMYFHSIIDNTAECDANVVPLGTVTVGTPSTFNGTQLPDTFTGHLANDLSSEATTPKFGFITPNLCDDGHDATCAGTNLDGTHTGGLAGGGHLAPALHAAHHGFSVVPVRPDARGHHLRRRCAHRHDRVLQRAARSELGLSRVQPVAGHCTHHTRRRSRRREVGALLLNSEYIQPGTVDTTGLLQPLFGLAQLRGSARTDQWRHGRGRPPRVRCRSRADALRPGHLPARGVADDQHQSTESIRRHRGGLTFTAAADITTPTIQWQASVNGGKHLDQPTRGDQPHLHRRAAHRIRERLGGQGRLHQLRGVGDHQPRHDHGDRTDDQRRTAVERRHAVG